MEIFTAYPSNAEQAQAIKQFFETQQIRFDENAAAFTFDHKKTAQIKARVQQALASGLWEKMTDGARQDYILGAIVEQTDPTNALDADTLKAKIRRRIHESTSHSTV